ncbi:ABC transporter substrate-binding protein [Paenalkalicoccus suaedae]|uniref:ABC transporter substrate-binding protein n=2 Tax=Paenalkalicoccus suaedae TaxID=2592382 RepID=A0A859FKG5_9BACI|nr:ABC transporter substrate-binding protein [Paenalkalicoccus suaedae]
MRSIFYAPQYVAISEGFFEEEGIEIDLTTTWGGDTTMTALLSDGADVALVGAETSIYVYAQDARDPVISFAQVTKTDGTFLMQRDLDEPFSFDALKGQTLLGQRRGGMPQMVGEYVLKQHGIDPHTDMELISNIDFGNIAAAFASGTGDYVQLFEPQATQFEQDGIGKIVASFGTESGFLPYTVYMAKESKLDSLNLEGFNRALAKAQAFVHEQDSATVAQSLQPFFEDTPLATIEEVFVRYRDQGSYATEPGLKEEEWHHLQDIMEEANELPARVDFDTLVKPVDVK